MRFQHLVTLLAACEVPNGSVLPVKPYITIISIVNLRYVPMHTVELEQVGVKCHLNGESLEHDNHPNILRSPIQSRGES